MANFFNSLPDSFTSNTVIGKDKLPLSVFDFNTSSNVNLPSGFGLEAFTLPPGTINLKGYGQTPTWTFITAPEDVSWDIANQADRVNMFGTNGPPVVSGTKGMRDLKLGNSLVEGFVRGKNVEGKIAALENLMRYGENLSDGFVSVPVYQIWASDKSYGGSNAYYIIKDVNVKETMRDLRGNATRAYVDVSLMEVPAYQVNTGRDQANAATSGVKSSLISNAQARALSAAAEATKNATSAANQGVGTTQAASGARSASGGKQPGNTPVRALPLDKPQRILP